TTQGFGKQASDSFNLVTSSALKMFGAFLGAKGLKDFTVDTTNAGAAIGRLAFNTAQATQEVSIWQNAVELLGGNGEAAGASMQSLTQSLQEFALTGQSSVI